MQKTKLTELQELIDKEIEWCNANKSMVSEDEFNGFIKGLIQAKELANKLDNLL